MARAATGATAADRAATAAMGPGPAVMAPGRAVTGRREPDGRRHRRHRFMLAGASAGMAAVLAVVGLGAVNAVGSSTLTTSQIAAKVNPGLVDMVSTLGYQNGEAAGTGMVLTSTGEVLTNNHVIDGATAIRVTDVGNGRTYTATVVGYDKSRRHRRAAARERLGADDGRLAALRASGRREGGRARQRLGKGGTPSVATGKVTATRPGPSPPRTRPRPTPSGCTGLIQTNADIQPGDSGGPLVNTARRRHRHEHRRLQQHLDHRSAAVTAGHPGVRHPDQPRDRDRRPDRVGPGRRPPCTSAPPPSWACRSPPPRRAAPAVTGALRRLLRQRVRRRRQLDGQRGPVAGAVSGSAAAQAGLTQGDVITSVAGHTITTPTGVSSALAQHHPGDKVSIGWTDQTGQSHTATVQLGAGRPTDYSGRLGRRGSHR